MGTESMRENLAQCSNAYQKTGAMVKSQLDPFMRPMLRFMGEALTEIEMAKIEHESIAMSLAVHMEVTHGNGD